VRFDYVGSPKSTPDRTFVKEEERKENKKTADCRHQSEGIK